MILAFLTQIRSQFVKKSINKLNSTFIFFCQLKLKYFFL